jgi:hypothetical protein
VRQRRQDAVSSAASRQQRPDGLFSDYLDAAGHGTDENGALFRPIRDSRTGKMDRASTANGLPVVRSYSAEPDFEIGAHALRGTAATGGLTISPKWPRCGNGLAM